MTTPRDEHDGEDGETEPDSLRRRQVLAAAAAVSGALAGCNRGTPTPADETDEPTPTATETPTATATPTATDTETATPATSATVRVGILQPTSGGLGYYGRQSLWGFYSGLAYRARGRPLGPESVEPGEYTYEVDGITYELLVRDTGFDADQAAETAARLVSESAVDLLVGGASAAVATRVVESVVERAGVPMLAGPTATPALTGERCHDLVFRTSETTPMTARAGAAYLATETDAERVALFGADYQFGRDVVENYAAFLDDTDVAVLEPKYVPIGFEDWDPLLEEAEAAGADYVVGGLTAQTLPNLYGSHLRSDYSFHVMADLGTRIAADSLGDRLRAELGPSPTAADLRDAGVGPFTSAYHWTQYDNPVNRAFVETCVETYGAVPDRFTAGTFTAASALDQAVRAAGSTAGEAVAAALRGMTVEATPKGPGAYRFQSYNNQARSPVTVADLVPTSQRWADAWDAPVMPGEPLTTVPGSVATLPADSDRMGCSL